MPRASASTTTEPTHVTVYGLHPVIIGWGSEADMQAYADKMNAQAPKYNHRVLPVGEVSKKGKR